MMQRRNFLKNTSLGAIGTLYIPQFLQSANLLAGQERFKRLIVIQLSGGNDGLNTVIPYEDDIYYRLRPQLGIPKNDVLRASDYLGFNPNLKQFNQLFQEGYVSVINSVGYPNPNRSHFRSMDIWHTATGANEYSKTGWLGRYMDSYCQHAHDALELDSQLSMSLYGQQKNGLAIEKSSALQQALQGPYFNNLVQNAEPKDLDEDNLGYLYKTLVQTHESAAYLKEAHNIKQENYPFPKSKLGEKLNTLSQFIRSGLSTKVYYVSHNGFDSHVNQLDKQGRLLKEYSEGVYALVKSLEKSGHFEDTLILTFSEFGRRVQQNASRGTDHGKANNLFLIGKNLRKTGFYNTAPDLANLDDGDISYTIDFRNVYADIIRNWFGENPNAIIRKQFGDLGVV